MSSVVGRYVAARKVAGAVVQAFKSGVDKLLSYVLHWNGVDTSAYMPDGWTPGGYNGWIDFDFTVDAIGANQHIFSGTNSERRPALYVDTGGLMHFLGYDAALGTTFDLTGPTITAGQRVRGRVVCNGDNTRLIVNGTTYTQAARCDITDLVEHIAIRGDTNAAFFDGIIHQLDFRTNLASDCSLVTGNGVDLYALLSSPITLTQTWAINIRWRRKNAGGGGKTPIFSNGGGNNFALFVHDTDSANPGQIELRNGSGTVIGAINGTLNHVAEGSEVTISIANAAGLFILAAVDGAFTGGMPQMNTITIDRVGHAGGLYFDGEIVEVKLLGDSALLEPDYLYQFIDLPGAVAVDLEGSSVTATLQNYDSGTDQVEIPRLERRYTMDDGLGAKILEDQGADIVNTITNGPNAWGPGAVPVISDGDTISYPGAHANESLIHNDYTDSASAIVMYGEIEVKAGTPADVGKTLRLEMCGGGPQFNSGATLTVTLTEQYQKYRAYPFDTRGAGYDFSSGARMRLSLDSTPVATVAKFRNAVIRRLSTEAVLQNVDNSDWES